MSGALNRNRAASPNVARLASSSSSDRRRASAPARSRCVAPSDLVHAIAVGPLPRQENLRLGVSGDDAGERLARFGERAIDARVFGARAIGLRREFPRFELEALPFGRHPIAHSGRVVARLRERSQRRRRRHHRGAHRIRLLLDGLHGRQRPRVLALADADPLGGVGERDARALRRRALRCHGRARGLTAPFEVAGFERKRLGLLRQALDLLAVELHLLLPPAVFQLSRVRGVARRGRAGLGLRQLEANGLERGLELRHMRGRGRLTRASVSQLASVASMSRTSAA